MTLKDTGERFMLSNESPEINYEHWHRYLYATEFVKDKVVLDIACGMGYGSYLLSGYASSVVGIDINPDAVLSASNTYVKQNLQYLVGTVGNIPLDRNHFIDVITSFETIEHIPEEDQTKFLQEVKRLLKPDGLLIISTPNKLYYSDLANYKNEFHVREFYLSEFKNFLSDRFMHVHILGQRVNTGSYIWVEHSRSVRVTEYRLEHDRNGFKPTNAPNPMVYAIALCSDQDIEKINNSVLIDLSDSIVKNRDKRIAFLDTLIADKEVHIGNLDTLVKSKDEQLLQLKSTLLDRDVQASQLVAHATNLGLNLNAIYSSRGWRLLLQYYKVRNWLFPENSKRRFVVQTIWKVKNTLSKTMRYYSNYGSKRLFKKIVSKMGFKMSFHIDGLKNPKMSLSVPVQNYDSTYIVPSVGSSVSIIIPTFNAGPSFPFLLTMLKQQIGLTDIEIILVDSGSSDGTIAYAQKQNINIVQIPLEKFTHSYARNLGAEHATGSFLLFTVQDALPPSKSWLYNVLQALQNNNVSAVSCSEAMREDCDLFYRAMYWNHFKFLELDKGDRILTKPAQDDFLSLRKNAQLSDVACLIPRKLFLKYRYRYDYAEDLDLGIRLIKDGHRLALLSSLSIIHSHNRPASYYLKRWYVETLTLPSILPDMPNPSVSWPFVVGDIRKAYTLTRIMVHDVLSQQDLPRDSALLIPFLLNAMSSICIDIQNAKVINVEDDPYLDDVFKVMLKTSLTHDAGNASGPPCELLVTSVIKSWQLVLEYLNITYEAIDETVLRDLRDCFYKSLAVNCGHILACCYLNNAKISDPAYQELHDLLTTGI